MAIVITRYVYIVWLKNPGAVHDNFWNRLLCLWIISFSFIFNFILYILPGETIVITLFTHTEPQSDKILTRLYYIMGLLDFCTPDEILFAVHIKHYSFPTLVEVIPI